MLSNVVKISSWSTVDEEMGLEIEGRETGGSTGGGLLTIVDGQRHVLLIAGTTPGGVANWHSIL